MKQEEEGASGGVQLRSLFGRKNQNELRFSANFFWEKNSGKKLPENPNPYESQRKFGKMTGKKHTQIDKKVVKISKKMMKKSEKNCQKNSRKRS